jgi:hypothetical protein
MIARHFPQCHIDRLNGIGGVDHLTDVLGKGKEWNDACPVCPPRLADGWVERIPFLGKQFQIKLGFRLGTGGVDGDASRSRLLSCACVRRSAASCASDAPCTIAPGSRG